MVLKSLILFCHCRQLFSSPSEAFSDALSINGQNYEEPSLEPINLSMFQCRNGEQLQVCNLFHIYLYF